MSEEAYEPDVSVILLTYNHERYIETALESVLAQEGDFTFEIIISEDCSTDDTRSIVDRFASMHRDAVYLFEPTANIGAMASFVRAYNSTRGALIAYLDGDDYWKPGKLARQVEYMRTHPDCPMCFHACEIVGDGSVEGGGDVAIPGRNANYKGDSLSFAELAQHDPINSCSVLLRRHVLGELPEWFTTLEVGDWALWLLLAQHGDIGYIDEVLGTYRVHAGGLWSGAGAVRRREIEVRFLKSMRSHFVEHRREFSDSIASSLMRSARAREAVGNRAGACSDVLRSLAAAAPHLHPRQIKDAAKVLGRVGLPRASAALAAAGRAARVPPRHTDIPVELDSQLDGTVGSAARSAESGCD